MYTKIVGVGCGAQCQRPEGVCAGTAHPRTAPAFTPKIFRAESVVITMFTFAEIEKMLEKGFTPEQITSMNNSPAAGEDQTQGDAEQVKNPENPAPAEPAADTAPAWAQTLTDSINGLKRTMQAAALAGAQQNPPASVDEQAAEALAAIIAPTFKKEGR